MSVQNMRRYLIHLPRWRKRLLIFAVDSMGCLVALLLAVGLQGHAIDALFTPPWQIPLVLAVTLFASTIFRLYSSVIRYIAVRAALRVAQAAALAVMLLAALRLIVIGGVPALELPVLINYGLLLLLSLGTVRLLARHFLGRVTDRNAERMVIYGAGEAGIQAAQSLRADGTRHVVAFVDDDNDFTGNEIADLPVFHSDKLPDLIKRKKVSSVLLAIPSAQRSQKQRIIQWLEPLHVTVKTIPGLQEILSGRAQISEIRNIELEDLLGRDVVPPNQELLADSIEGQSVMITGAGGSIGSELCRQILPLGPAQLILFEISEYALFNIERELLALAGPNSEVRVIAVLGNVLDRELVETSMRRFQVQTVYHAAAYKHVPLVEGNVSAGLQNNVFGTLHVAEAALAHGARRCILISTDKAVRPTNVMGATKRVAELVMQAMAQRASTLEGASCIFSMVRFGNVLGSSGSVVPSFQKQIERGGPVTVTHPDINRFFMTIPEASQLVIHAGAMARGGEVFVLDMGQPIRILDLAKRMVGLSGYTVRDGSNPLGDIEIVFSGLRPGEKLYEELLIGESTLPTSHPKIGCAQEAAMSWPELESLLRKMQRACSKYQRGLVKHLLQQAVAEYSAAEKDYDAFADSEAYDQEVQSLFGHDLPPINVSA